MIVCGCDVFVNDHNKGVSTHVVTIRKRSRTKLAKKKQACVRDKKHARYSAAVRGLLNEGEEGGVPHHDHVSAPAHTVRARRGVGLGFRVTVQPPPGANCDVCNKHSPELQKTARQPWSTTKSVFLSCRDHQDLSLTGCEESK